MLLSWVRPIRVDLDEHWPIIPCSAVILYDCIITFGEEVRLIWCYGSRGKNVVAASMLFLVHRYLAIIYGVIGFVAGTVPLVCLFSPIISSKHCPDLIVCRREFAFEYKTIPPLNDFDCRTTCAAVTRLTEVVVLGLVLCFARMSLHINPSSATPLILTLYSPRTECSHCKYGSVTC